MMQSERVAGCRAYVQDTPHRIIRAATYRFHGSSPSAAGGTRVSGRDARTQTPPFSGRYVPRRADVANLAWKLALITQLKASPTLLRQLSGERRAACARVIEAAIAAAAISASAIRQAARKRDETLAPRWQAGAGFGEPISPAALRVGSSARAICREGARSSSRKSRITAAACLLDDVTAAGSCCWRSSRAVLAALRRAMELWNYLGGKSFVIDRDAVDAGSIHDIDGELGAWLAASAASRFCCGRIFMSMAWPARPRKLGAMIGKWRRHCAPRAALRKAHLHQPLGVSRHDLVPLGRIERERLTPRWSWRSARAARRSRRPPVGAKKSSPQGRPLLAPNSAVSA